jgi:hypothetical protein
LSGKIWLTKADKKYKNMVLPTIPAALMMKCISSGYWEERWMINPESQEETIATSFRLRNGRIVILLITKDGEILLLLNPLQYQRGDPVDPVYFDFEPAEIVALAGGRKKRKWFWPWPYEYEYFDLVII